MNILERDKSLLEVIRQALVFFGQWQTKAMLGDRSEYLGLSDVASYGECPRMAIADKIMSKDGNLETILPLQRGHWFENGIAKSLAHAGLKFLPQLEISCKRNDVPVCAHLDFTLAWDKPRQAVRVLEVKSVDKIPPIPHEAHAMQVQSQVNLLYEFWKEPVFSLKNTEGKFLYENMSFPLICRKYLGIQMPASPDVISVESWILYLSMKNAQAFGPYTFDSESREWLFHTVGEVWSTLGKLRSGEIALNNVPYAKGYNLFCGWCAVSADCPKFRDGAYQPQWNEAIRRLVEIKSNRASLDNAIKEIESALRQAYQLSNIKTWINTGENRFRVTNVAGRKTLDREALKGNLIQIFTERGIHEDVDRILSRCERDGSPSSRLNIIPVE